MRSFSGSTVETALILAAGNGTRLVSREALPKPLVRVGGRTLLNRVLHMLEGTTIEQVLVVTGYKGEEIRKSARKLQHRGRDLQWVDNPDFHLGNGLSLLAGREKIQGKFLLLMSDHLLDPSIIEDLLDCPLSEQGGLLATDAQVESVFDLDDATKVRSRGDWVIELGKGLQHFDRIDVGAFVLHDSIFPLIEECVREGRTSLSAGMSVLAAEGKLGAYDIGARSWIDIDTPAALRRAEEMSAAGLFRRRETAA